MKSFLNLYPKRLATTFAFIFVICLIHSISSGGIFKTGLLEAGGIPETVILNKSNPGIQKAIAAQDKHTDILLSEPGIVGTAVGLDEHGKPAILVLATSFNEAKAATIPSDIEGIPVIAILTVQQDIGRHL